ncbi:MAG: hypothetical protein V4595_06025 [Pseudomonadota bacterium]|jgi:hypothetical protein
MQQIDIDFEVFKALTILRESESHTYNEVLRDLLGLQKGLGRQLSEGINRAFISGSPAKIEGFSSRGLFLPNGTLLRATYKKAEYRASIVDGQWVGEDGVEHSSPSAAATHVTGTTVNGLRFWLAKRPSDGDWKGLDALPVASR